MRLQLRFDTGGRRQDGDSGKLPALPVQIVARNDVAEQMGLQELVDVFAFPDARRGQGMSSDFEHYMAVKRAADIAVATSSLD